MDENKQNPTQSEDFSIDEFLADLHKDIDRFDEAQKEEKSQFQPKLPKEYAELDASPKAQKKRGVSVGKKTFIYVTSVLLISAILAVFLWNCADDVCAFTRHDQTIAVTIQPDDTVDDVATKLQQKGLIYKKWLFKIYCKLAHADRKIQPGVYQLNAVFDYHALVSGMSSAALRTEVGVTVPEGYTMAEIFALLEDKGVATADALAEAAEQTDFDYAFLQGVPLGEANRLEGCLFPDTYFFYVNDDPVRVLDKFLVNLDGKLTQELWDALDTLNGDLATRKRAAGFTEAEIEAEKLTMYDILTVASLIEKESAGSTENALIASVIYNRLCSKAYPFLNIDATIQYALGEHKAVLYDKDKEIDSPYNTYKYMGLPKGPIACPGMIAIRGALYPQSTDYYFYALAESGMHHFSRTYEEHLAFLANNG
ncbi:MAG: endolytic transglycosylase MltG [Oscillospiraceae bacterium]|nr:endolytic transglycosylase MltG [Oscillospiraceae bacterium]